MSEPNKINGMTFVELLVAAIITVLLIGAAFKILTSIRHTTSVATARGAAKGIAEVVLRSLEHDISNSRAQVKFGNDGNPIVERSFQPLNHGWTMLIPEGNSSKRITYYLDGKKLLREDASGTTRVLADSIENLEITDLGNARILADLKIGLVPEGMQEAVLHNQQLIITIREAVEGALDPRWRNANEVLNYY